MASEHIDPGTAPTSTWKALTHSRTLFTMLMFSIFLVMVLVSIDYAWPANFLPYVIGIPGIALTALQIFLDVRAYHKAGGEIDPRTDFERYMDEIIKHTGPDIELDVAKEKLEVLVEDHSVDTRSRTQREALLFGYFFFLLAITLLFGYWLAIPVFLFLFLRYYAHESLKLSLMITAAVWSGMYFLLVILLEQILWEGFITNWVWDTWISD